MVSRHRIIKRRNQKIISRVFFHLCHYFLPFLSPCLPFFPSLFRSLSLHREAAPTNSAMGLGKPCKPPCTGVRGGSRPQMHFWCISSPGNASCYCILLNKIWKNKENVRFFLDSWWFWKKFYFGVLWHLKYILLIATCHYWSAPCTGRPTSDNESPYNVLDSAIDAIGLITTSGSGSCSGQEVQSSGCRFRTESCWWVTDQICVGHRWWRGIVGGTPVFGRRTDPVLRSAWSRRVTIMWVNRLLQVSQLQLSLSSFRVDKWVVGVFIGCVLRWRHLVNAYGVISLVRLIAAA